MSRIVPLPTTNTVVDNTVAVINANGSVASFGGAGGVATLYADQQVVTASAVALTTQALTNGVSIKAKPTNTGSVFIGAAGVTATDDGSGNGFALRPGEAVNLPITSTAGIFIIGTASDVIYVIGN
jgi:hypothetical protein